MSAADIKKWAGELRTALDVSADDAHTIAQAMQAATDIIEADDAQRDGWFRNTIDRALKELVEPAMNAAGIETEGIGYWAEANINPAGYRRYEFAPLFWVKQSEDINRPTVCWDNEKGEMFVGGEYDWRDEYEQAHEDDFRTAHGLIRVPQEGGAYTDDISVDIDQYPQKQWGARVERALADEVADFAPRVQFSYGYAAHDEGGDAANVHDWTETYPMTAGEFRALIYAFPDKWLDIAVNSGQEHGYEFFRAELKRAKRLWVSEGKGEFPESELDGHDPEPEDGDVDGLGAGVEASFEDRAKRRRLQELTKEWLDHMREVATRHGTNRGDHAQIARDHALSEMWMEARRWIATQIIDTDYQPESSGDPQHGEADLQREIDNLNSGALEVVGQVVWDTWDVDPDEAPFPGMPEHLDDIEDAQKRFLSKNSENIGSLWHITNYVRTRAERAERAWYMRETAIESAPTPPDDVMRAYVLLPDPAQDALDEYFPDMLRLKPLNIHHRPWTGLTAGVVLAAAKRAAQAAGLE